MRVGKGWRLFGIGMQVLPTYPPTLTTKCMVLQNISSLLLIITDQKNGGLVRHIQTYHGAPPVAKVFQLKQNLLPCSN